MNKSGDIVILNDLKKEREDVKKQYEEQKKKKFTDKHAILYCIGFAAVLVATCIICPANFWSSVRPLPALANSTWYAFLFNISNIFVK